MSQEPDSIVLRMLREIRGDLGRLAEDVRDIKIRMTGVEEGLAGVNRRLDRMEADVTQIKKRLDLVDV